MHYNNYPQHEQREQKMRTSFSGTVFMLIGKVRGKFQVKKDSIGVIRLSVIVDNGGNFFSSITKK